jgi:hypothetical protein
LDEQRLANLQICFRVLESSQKEYAKSKGIHLPPLETLPEVDSDCDIGEPMGRGAGGLISGKLWRLQREAKPAKDKQKKTKLSVKARKVSKSAA